VSPDAVSGRGRGGAGCWIGSGGSQGVGSKGISWAEGEGKAGRLLSLEAWVRFGREGVGRDAVGETKLVQNRKVWSAGRWALGRKWRDVEGGTWRTR
jgi:hypothetical protein